MAKKNPDERNDHVKYVGNHPHVAIDGIGDFTRGVPAGPFDDETIAVLTGKKDRDGKKAEFVRCGATAEAPVAT